MIRILRILTPRGLRIALQGSCGVVSTDVFYTSLPGPSRSHSYCLLALKEDPEEKLPPPPDASQSIPQIPQIQTSRQSRSRSSISELLVAYDNLLEIALLVNNVTGGAGATEQDPSENGKLFIFIKWGFV